MCLNLFFSLNLAWTDIMTIVQCINRWWMWVNNVSKRPVLLPWNLPQPISWYTNASSLNVCKKMVDVSNLCWNNLCVWFVTCLDRFHNIIQLFHLNVCEKMADVSKQCVDIIWLFELYFAWNDILLTPEIEIDWYPNPWYSTVSTISTSCKDGRRYGCEFIAFLLRSCISDGTAG